MTKNGYFRESVEKPVLGVEFQELRIANKNFEIFRNSVYQALTIHDH